MAAVALVLSAIVTYTVYQTLRDRFQPAVEHPENLVVAASTLNLGQRIESSDVLVVQWPSGRSIDGSFNSLEEVVGRGVIVPMLANEPVLESKLAPQGAGSGLTSAIPEGKRALAVKVDEIVGVAGFVLPGTRVDVILVGSPDKNREVEISKVILENVQVLAAGQNLEQDSEGAAQKVQVVTLLVTPLDAEKLALAQNDGRIQLALRNPIDLATENPEAVHKASLYGRQVDQPAPRPASSRRSTRRSPPKKVEAPALVIPRPIHEVELIQGARREKFSFPERPGRP